MKSTTTIDPTEIPTAKLYSYLVSSVAPRPIAFVSTIDKKGQVNISPFSFFNAFSANPPLVIFSSSRRVRDGTNKHTIENIHEVKEVVINTVNYPMVEQMSLASTEYEKGVNEFIKAGLTEVPSDLVAPPRVAQSPVAMECIVEQIIEAGTEGGAGNIVIARVVKIHIQDQFLDQDGNIDTLQLDMVGRMGGSWYCRASGDALFEIPKPLRTKGIGVDQLPQHIRESDILTGNQLARLANIEQLPSRDTVSSFLEMTPQLLSLINKNAKGSQELSKLIHHQAIALLEGGKTEEALMTLMCLEE